MHVLQSAKNPSLDLQTMLPKVPQKKSLQVGLGHMRRDEAERIMAESYSLPRWASSVAGPPGGPLEKKKKMLSCN